MDDSVLIIDNILDQSILRNGKPCLYQKIGLKKAIIYSKFLETEAFNTLEKLTIKLKVKDNLKLLIFTKFNEFIKNIYIDQKINFEITGKNIVQN